MFALKGLRLVDAYAGRGEHIQATSYFTCRAKELETAMDAAAAAEAALHDAPEPDTLTDAIAQLLANAAAERDFARRFAALRVHARHVDRFATGVLLAAMMRTRPQTTMSELCEGA